MWPMTLVQNYDPNVTIVMDIEWVRRYTWQGAVRHRGGAWSWNTSWGRKLKLFWDTSELFETPMLNYLRHFWEIYTWQGAGPKVETHHVAESWNYFDPLLNYLEYQCWTIWDTSKKFKLGKGRGQKLKHITGQKVEIDPAGGKEGHHLSFIGFVGRWHGVVGVFTRPRVGFTYLEWLERAVKVTGSTRPQRCFNFAPHFSFELQCRPWWKSVIGKEQQLFSHLLYFSKSKVINIYAQAPVPVKLTVKKMVRIFL